MMFGAFLSSRLKGGDKPRNSKESETPKVWRDRFGNNKAKRYLSIFVGGFLVLFGSRMAGGCTSGHMMSGMMQTALSGYIFTISVFVSAIPTSILLYRNWKKPYTWEGAR